MFKLRSILQVDFLIDVPISKLRSILEVSGKLKIEHRKAFEVK